MAKIYSNYRGKRYFEIRSLWEPWYSNVYNSNHDSLDWIQSRKSAITQFITPRLDNPALRVADIGGDTGQFIPDFAILKYVVDPSGKKAAAGVTSISGMKDLPDVDLIIYAHVLEHVADPIAEIKILLSKASQIYVEVPFGVPEVTVSRKSRMKFYKTLLKSLSPSLWKGVTFPSTGRRNLSQGTLTQSEHLNFVSEESLLVLSKLVGARVEICKTQIETPDYSKADVLQCLFTVLEKPDVPLSTELEEK
jgi:hypothetical protein